MRKTVTVLASYVVCAIVAAFAAQSSVLSRPALAGTHAIADAEQALGYIQTLPPVPIPAATFTDGDGKPVTLADKRGKVVLLNIWATWCPPCVREMPSLDRLQARFGGRDFEVVAVSEDRGGAAVVNAFYKRLGLTSLALYLDPNAGVSRALNVLGLPTTILIDRDGNEVGRVPGPADWDSGAAEALVRHYIDGLATTTEAAG